MATLDSTTMTPIIYSIVSGSCQLNGCSIAEATVTDDVSAVMGIFSMGKAVVTASVVTSTVWCIVITQSGNTNDATAVASSTIRFRRCHIRPSNKLMDRKALGVEDAQNAVNGVYYLRRAQGKADGTIFVQGAGVGREVVEKVLPVLKENVNIIYITSRELFEQLPKATQEKLVPAELLKTAMGITDFTLPTLDCWLNSVAGREHSLYPHKDGKFLSSGSSAKVYEEAHLDGASLLKAIKTYVDDLKKASTWR